MEGECRKCEQVTKYKCLACSAQNFRNHENYRKQEKLTGKC